MRQIIKLIAAIYSALAYLNIINEQSIIPIIFSLETQIFKKLKIRLALQERKKRSTSHFKNEVKFECNQLQEPRVSHFLNQNHDQTFPEKKVISRNTVSRRYR